MFDGRFLRSIHGMSCRYSIRPHYAEDKLGKIRKSYQSKISHSSQSHVTWRAWEYSSALNNFFNFSLCVEWLGQKKRTFSTVSLELTFHFCCHELKISSFLFGLFLKRCLAAFSCISKSNARKCTTTCTASVEQNLIGFRSGKKCISLSTTKDFPCLFNVGTSLSFWVNIWAT